MHTALGISMVGVVISLLLFRTNKKQLHSLQCYINELQQIKGDVESLALQVKTISKELHDGRGLHRQQNLREFEESQKEVESNLNQFSSGNIMKKINHPNRSESLVTSFDSQLTASAERDPNINASGYISDDEQELRQSWSDSTHRHSAKKMAIYRIILLGDAGVGKTSIAKQYIDKQFVRKYSETIGTDFSLKHTPICTLQIWDTPSHDSGKYKWIPGVTCCVLVYDVTSKASFFSLEAKLNNFLQDLETDDPSKLVIVVVGNKCDLRDQVPLQEVTKWCIEKGGLEHFEISAANNQQVSSVFNYLIEKLTGKRIPKQNSPKNLTESSFDES